MAHPSYIKGTLSYPNKFTESELIVIIDNTTPEVVAKVGDGIYGTPTISGLSAQTPIRIAFENGVNEIAVKNMDAGGHNVKIQGVTPSKVETTECFKKAVLETVKSLNAPLVLNINNSALDKTFAEIRDAYLSGRTVLLDPVNQTPTLRVGSSKNYYSITEMSVSNGRGGTLVFGTDVVRYSANADDAYPTLVS